MDLISAIYVMVVFVVFLFSGWYVYTSTNWRDLIDLSIYTLMTTMIVCLLLYGLTYVYAAIQIIYQYFTSIT